MTDIPIQTSKGTDVIISDVRVQKQHFKPLTCQDQDVLCARLKLVNENVQTTVATNVDVMGCPCQIKNIKPDGNCFYRSLSFSICQNEEKHLKIRRSVVQHLEKNSFKFELYLRDEYTSVKDYVTKSRMYYCGSWATEIDIYAAADFLDTTIMTFNDGRWNAHRPTTTNPQSCTENGIFLNHTGNHYEVVQCVKQRDAQNVCAGMCQPGEIDLLKTRLRKRKLMDGRENVKAKKEREQYWKNSDYREQKLKILKDKYHKESQTYKLDNYLRKYKTNREFQKLRREYCKSKYRKNLDFKESVRAYSKSKYRRNVDFKESVRAYSKSKYRRNVDFKESVRAYSKSKYRRNVDFKESVRAYSKSKYRRNVDFKESVQAYSKSKYRKNLSFQATVRTFSKTKYKTNRKFQSFVRDYGRNKYRRNTIFQNQIKQHNNNKYQENENISVNKIQRSCEDYAWWQKRRENLDFAISHFRQEVSRDPEYVC
ncbi:uncharacterized protein LOC124489115 [Hypomesus transpacificus]|uniref:uncharacterized protein LOC124489115 n=1 Tax=Hypomesus transpacificus TaxID=137520 RepID=UPI001F074D9E|nr:uncharacterized protein LOC124489115 [Hypomesus transpacificus]